MPASSREELMLQGEVQRSVTVFEDCKKGERDAGRLKNERTQPSESLSTHNSDQWNPSEGVFDSVTFYQS
jgi:hypothetical protein